MKVILLCQRLVQDGHVILFWPMNRVEENLLAASQGPLRERGLPLLFSDLDVLGDVEFIAQCHLVMGRGDLFTQGGY